MNFNFIPFHIIHTIHMWRFKLMRNEMFLLFPSFLPSLSLFLLFFLVVLVKHFFSASWSIQDSLALWAINNGRRLTSTIIDNYRSFALASQSGNLLMISTNVCTYSLTSDLRSLTTIDRLFSPTPWSRSTPVGDLECFFLAVRSLIFSNISRNLSCRNVTSWITSRKN